MAEKNIIYTKTFERIQQYKVDFAYSKNLFYSALNRLNQEEKDYLKYRKYIDVVFHFSLYYLFQVQYIQRWMFFI